MLLALRYFSSRIAHRSDAAVKQLILSLDERNRFIIMDLDETHLLISPDRIDWLRSELEVEVSVTPQVFV